MSRRRSRSVPAARGRPETDRGCRRARRIRRAHAPWTNGCSRCAPARPRPSPSARRCRAPPTAPGLRPDRATAPAARRRSPWSARSAACRSPSAATASPARSAAAPGCRNAARRGHRAGSPRPESASRRYRERRTPALGRAAASGRRRGTPRRG